MSDISDFYFSNNGLQKYGLTEFFDVGLHDLGAIDSRFEGIYAPEQDAGAEKVGITAQFLENAETYHARYGHSAHFLRLFQDALGVLGRAFPSGMAILDIGTGAGTNTIEPCLQLFADCRIVATDLSPNLLRLLHDYTVSHGLQHRVACVCTDAMSDYFRPRSFDLVVGAAILHHLQDPNRALDSVYRALRPGGTAVFFEPFEGVAGVRLMFEMILDRARRDDLPLEPALAQFLSAMILDYATRAGTDRSAPHFRHMDDKWLFTRDWMERAARRAGFTEVTIVPHAHHETLFLDFTTVLLRLGGLEPDAMPGWGLDMIRMADRCFSPDLKRDLSLEATVVLRKPL